MLNDPAQLETVNFAMQNDPPSLRAKRSNPTPRAGRGSLRREAPREGARRGGGAALPEFSHSLPMLLLRGREAVMRQFRPLLRAHGLSEQQWRILRTLSGVETIEVTELAHRAFLLGPSLSRMLRDLQARKLIARKPARDDQRRIMVSLTATGGTLIEMVVPFSEDIYAAIAQRCGEAKLGDLQEMLVALERSLSAMPVRHAAAAVDSVGKFRSTRRSK
jgi:homoprotocatechuate degradation regulator HpaR